MSIATVTLLVILGYLVALKGISYAANRLSQTTVEDFFVADRNTGLIALLGTIVATKVNALALTTAPAFVYEGGILFLQTFIALGISGGLLVYFGPKVWDICKQQHFLTQAELFAFHYQSPGVGYLTTALGLLSVFPFLIVQFVAVAKVFSAATDGLVSYPIAIAILGISTAFYVFLGGARAVIWTDVVQGLFLFTLIVLTAILFTHWVGGYGQGWHTLRELIPEKLSFNADNTPVFFDQVLSWSFAFFLWPQIFQRAMMGKSVQVIQRAGVLHMLLGFVIKLMLMTIGIMATAALYGQMSDSDRLVAAFYARQWPAGSILVVLAVFACGMSTIDSILLTLASILTRDVVEPFFPSLTQSDHRVQEYRLAQIVSLVTLAMVCGLALSPLAQGYLAPLVTLGATFATLLLWPLLGLFVWKTTSAIAVIATITTGLTTMLILHLFPTVLPQTFPVGSSTLVFLSSLVTFVAGNLWSPQPLQPSD